MGCSVSRVTPDAVLNRSGPAPRLVLYSEHAAAVPNFEKALQQCGTKLHRFDFEASDSSDLRIVIDRLVAEHGPFDRIAFAPHGPGRPPLPAARDGQDHECWWELTKNVVMTDPCQLSSEEHPARQVLFALGSATIPGGSVDLLSCAILSTWACPQAAWPSLRGFNSIEAEADCRFTACAHALSEDPLQSEDEWLVDSDESLNIKQLYFLPQPEGKDAMSEAQLAYAAANAALIKVAPIWRHYVLGVMLGRGSFATVREGTRRAAHHVYIPKRVAVKVIDKHKTDDPSAIKREVAFMTSLDHPNIIRLYEIFDASKKL